MHWKEVIYSDGSYEKKSRRRTWLTIWDKVKSHGTGIDWCTAREWPVNCMTVISAWWRSNMPFQRLSGQLNYYITRWRQEVSELEIRWVGARCGRESHHLAEGALRTPDWVWRSDQLVRRCWNENISQGGQAPRPLVEQPRRTRTTQGNVRRGWGGLYVAVFIRSPTPSHTQPFYNKVRGIFFLKKSWLVFIIASICLLHVDVCIDAYLLCGYTTIALIQKCNYLKLFIVIFHFFLDYSLEVWNVHRIDWSCLWETFKIEIEWMLTKFRL